jgi:hypothetical protein
MAAFAELRAQTGIAPACSACRSIGRDLPDAGSPGAVALCNVPAPASPKTTAGLERGGTVGAAARPQ